MEEFPRAKPARYDLFWDILDSDILAVVRIDRDRRTLFHTAIRGRSNEHDPDYRAQWHRDSTTARQIGIKRRETVNGSHRRLKALGITTRIDERPRRTSRKTVLADFPALCDIAEKYGGQPHAHDIRPAPRPAGKDLAHFLEQILDSEILDDLPPTAGEVLLLDAWHVQQDPDEPDFAQFTISAAKRAAILHRSPRAVRDALSLLESVDLYAIDGKTIKLQAHTAADFAACRPALRARDRRPFTDADKKRRKQERTKAKKSRQKVETAITYPHQDKSGNGDHTKAETAITYPGNGDHTKTETAITQNHKEPPQKTIRENHRRVSGNGQVNFCNGNGSTNGTAASTETKPANVSSASDIWIKAQEELAQEIPETTFETWIRDTSGRSYSQGNLIIDAPHKFARDWLKNCLTKKAKQALRRLTGADITVTFEIRGQPDPKTETTPPNDTAGTATLSQPLEGRHSDDGPVDDAADDSPQPEPEPEPQAQANQAPDLLRQAQDASWEERTAWMKNWQPVDTWIPVGSDHRKDAAQVARSP